VARKSGAHRAPANVITSSDFNLQERAAVIHPTPHITAPTGKNKPAKAGRVVVAGEITVAAQAAKTDKVPNQPTIMASFPRFDFGPLPERPFPKAIG
jgi:hypothetical protein